MASLLFDANGEYVDCGSPTHLDNIGGTVSLSGQYVAASWIYPADDASSPARTGAIISKNGWSGNMFAMDSALFGFVFARSIANTRVWANVANYTAWGTNKWLFVIGCLDLSEAGGPGASNTNHKILLGDLTTPPAAPSSYSSQINGNGSGNDNSSSNLYVGALSTSSGNFGGRVGMAGLWYRTGSTAVTVREMQEFWWRSLHGVANTGGTWTCRFLMWPGRFADASSTQPDLSGRGANGTVTLATAADGVPVGKLTRPVRKPGGGGTVGVPATPEARVKSLTLLGTG